MKKRVLLSIKKFLNDEVLSDLGINRENLVEQKAVEVGNIFTLGTKFSDPINLVYKDEEGKRAKKFLWVLMESVLQDSWELSWKFFLTRRG